jgi:hypothetical protein
MWKAWQCLSVLNRHKKTSEFCNSDADGCADGGADVLLSLKKPKGFFNPPN